jgi:hypothetical protein
MAKSQRKAFNYTRNNLRGDEVMIIFDFKENIKLGKGPVELNHEFYHRQQCSVYGCQVIYYNQIYQKVKTVNVDFFSDILSHDGVFVQDCLQKLLENIYDLCPGLGRINKINFWSDVGNHFRSQEVAHYLLVEVKKRFNIDVNWDTFVECHGKSTVDSHFGVLSQWMKDLENHKKIDTVEQLISCLQKKVQHSNRFRSASERSIYRFEIYKQEARPAMSKKLLIPNIRSFYHFEARLGDEEEKIVRLKVTSDSAYIEDEVINKKIKIIQESDQRITKYGSKCTEESSQSKIQKMGVDEVNYGPNTIRRFVWQAGHL